MASPMITVPVARATELAFVVLALALFALVASRAAGHLVDDAVLARAHAGDGKAFEVLQHADGSAVPGSDWSGVQGRPGLSLAPDDRFVLVEDAESFAALWQALHSYLPGAALPLIEPRIDFSSRSVLALFSASAPRKARGVEILRVESDAEIGLTTVIVLSSSPAPGCAAAPMSSIPWQLVAIDRPDRELEIREQHVERECS